MGNALYIHLRRYTVSTGSLGSVQTVASFEPTSEDFCAAPVIDALALWESGTDDQKRVAWRSPSGIAVRDFTDSQWSNVAIVTGTNSNCWGPSIINYNGTMYMLSWEDRGSPKIMYGECVEDAGVLLTNFTQQVSPPDWESNTTPCLGLSYSSGYKPTITWQSKNNIVELGSSVHVRTRGGLGDGQSWGNITSFSYGSVVDPQPVIGTYQSNGKLAVVWNISGTVYGATYNGSSWSGPTSLGSGSTGGTGVNINSETADELMTLWKKPNNVINTQTEGVNPSGERAVVGEDVMASAALGSPSSFPGDAVSYRLNRHAMVELKTLLGEDYVPLSDLSEDQPTGFIAFEMAGKPVVSGDELIAIDLRQAVSEAGFLGTDEHLLRTEPFAVDKPGSTVSFAGAIYGRGLQVPGDAEKTLGNMLARVVARDAASGQEFQELWTVPVAKLVTVAEGSFGEFRQISVDLSDFAGRLIYIDVDFVGENRGIRPVIVDDHLVLSTEPVDLQPGLHKKDQADDPIPTAYALHQNYPNPFNPSTTIEFDLPLAGDVSLTIFNLLGQQILTLHTGVMAAGRHSLRADLSVFPSGTYLYRLTAGSFQDTKRLILMK